MPCINSKLRGFSRVSLIVIAETVPPSLHTHKPPSFSSYNISSIFVFSLGQSRISQSVLHTYTHLHTYICEDACISSCTICARILVELRLSAAVTASMSPVAQAFATTSKYVSFPPYPSSHLMVSHTISGISIMKPCRTIFPTRNFPHTHPPWGWGVCFFICEDERPSSPRKTCQSGETSCQRQSPVAQYVSTQAQMDAAGECLLICEHAACQYP